MRIVDLRGKATVAVSVRDNVFDPPGIRIDAGTTVSWHNDGSTLHTIERADTRVVFPGAQQPFGADQLAVGDTYTFRFTKPGVYRYYCTLHGSPTSGMIGEVVVAVAPAPTSTSPTSVTTSP